MPDPVRVLYMAPDVVPFPKGAATRIEATVRALVSCGCQVVLLTPEGPGPSARLEGIGSLEHYTVPLGGPGLNFLDRMLSFRRAAGACIRQEPWDIVWFRSPWEGVPAVLEARRRPLCLVYEAHGFPSVELPFHYPRLSATPDLLDKLVDDEALVLQGADRVITPSATGRTYLRSRGVPSTRIEMVPNSVDVDAFFSPAAAPIAPLPLQVLYVGTMAPWQGLSTLVEAVAAARGRPDIRLICAGTLKGPWTRDLRRLAVALRVRSRLEILGPVARGDLPALYGRAHVCAAPLPDDPRNSLQGCCPIKILEYMAAARPILATRVRPVEEILAHGKTAWLARPGSPHALLEGLRWMAAHREAAEELGQNARAEAASSWTPEHFRQRIQGVLSRLGPGRASRTIVDLAASSQRT